MHGIYLMAFFEILNLFPAQFLNIFFMNSFPNSQLMLKKVLKKCQKKNVEKRAGIRVKGH